MDELPGSLDTARMPLRNVCQASQLSEKEINQIKSEIIQRAEKHIAGLQNFDYEEIMAFYANVDDFIVFGDGYYWGN